MHPDFWHKRWADNQIAFHEGEANALLTRHLGALNLQPDNRIFLPLCGKTRDIAWLLDQGYRIVGAELSEMAIRQLFDELGVTPEITERGALKRYAFEGVDVFVGDLFDLNSGTLGPVDAVYDRAALVAFPSDKRADYAAHLRALSGTAPQLLICFEYDQAAMDGPPFSVGTEEIAGLYADAYEISLLERIPVPGGLKKLHPADETAWTLRPTP